MVESDIFKFSLPPRNKGWWSKRTSMEKILTVICVIGALVSIALLVSLIVVAVNNNSDLDDICLTQACIAESSTVLSQMNLDADPYDLQLLLSYLALILSRFLQMRQLL